MKRAMGAFGIFGFIAGGVVSLLRDAPLDQLLMYAFLWLGGFALLGGGLGWVCQLLVREIKITPSSAGIENPEALSRTLAETERLEGLLLEREAAKIKELLAHQKRTADKDVSKTPEKIVTAPGGGERELAHAEKEV